MPKNTIEVDYKRGRELEGEEPVHQAVREEEGLRSYRKNQFWIN